MTKKFYKNEKFQLWFFSIFNFLLVLSIIVTGCFIFRKLYYLPIVVDGHSMWPTLAGGEEAPDGGLLRYHYGYADKHESSVNNLKRFDVVVTYYPDEWGMDKYDSKGNLIKVYKIKRVWGFPGEKLSLKFDGETKSYTFTAVKEGSAPYTITSSPLKEYTQHFEKEYKDSEGKTQYKDCAIRFTVNEFTLPNKSFRVSYDNIDDDTHSYKVKNFEYNLGPNEYFVMGDNFQGSTDSFDMMHHSAKLTKKWVKGKVICINAYASYFNSQLSNVHSIEPRYDF